MELHCVKNPLKYLGTINLPPTSKLITATDLSTFAAHLRADVVRCVVAGRQRRRRRQQVS